ncbi:hypothetical protein HDU86_004314 [Geranomyces michiganensis]|nr:hypothetical protein HDU86_004314 [Geranomyces michiganensis]
MPWLKLYVLSLAIAEPVAANERPVHLCRWHKASAKRPHSVLENEPVTPVKAQITSAQARKFTSPLRIFKTPPTIEPAHMTVSSQGTRVNRAFRSPVKGAVLTSANKGNCAHATAQLEADPEHVRTLRSEQRQLEAKIRQLVDRNRKMKLIRGYQSKDEARQVDALTVKWRRASREALVAFRTVLGPIQMSGAQQSYGGWGFADSISTTGAGGGYEPLVAEEPRIPTLKELCGKLNLDIEVFGEYDEDHDDFVDQ